MKLIDAIKTLKRVPVSKGTSKKMLYLDGTALSTEPSPCPNGDYAQVSITLDEAPSPDDPLFKDLGYIVITPENMDMEQGSFLPPSHFDKVGTLSDIDALLAMATLPVHTGRKRVFKYVQLSKDGWCGAVHKQYIAAFIENFAEMSDEALICPNGIKALKNCDRAEVYKTNDDYFNSTLLVSGDISVYSHVDIGVNATDIPYAYQNNQPNYTLDDKDIKELLKICKGYTSKGYNPSVLISPDGTIEYMPSSEAFRGQDKILRMGNSHIKATVIGSEGEGGLFNVEYLKLATAFGKSLRFATERGVMHGSCGRAKVVIAGIAY